MTETDLISINQPASSKTMNQDLTKEQFWSEAWTRHIDNYLAGPPRAGYWLHHRFGTNCSYLELAGGSCRDSRYLAEKGAASIGSDFDQKTLDYLHQKFPVSPLELRREDASALSFADKSVDISFSNGFWVLFRDDERILELVREQGRVSRQYMVVMVHNGDNQDLVNQYAEKLKVDPLYDIRMFGKDELASLIERAGIAYRSISLEKFGGPADALFRARLKGLPNLLQGVAPALVPSLYRWQSWAQTERVVAVVKLTA